MSAPVVRKIDGFTVIGITARTNNAREMTADGLIGKQWDRLFKEGILNKIPNKADSNIIAIYTAYASDHDGDYTYVLGAKVSPGAETPTGMVAVKVQPGKYAMFTSDRGIVTKVVPETWQRINSLPKSAVGGDRVYKTDFEVYDQRAADPQNSQMDVYIGIR